MVNSINAQNDVTAITIVHDGTMQSISIMFQSWKGKIMKSHLKYGASLLGATVIAIGLSSVALAQNQLINGGFEVNPPPGNGNNINYAPTGWVFGGGDQPNVVKVDGSVNIQYGANGPEKDASGLPGVRHYLDIVGRNSFYQVFTPKCNGEVKFGGAFSSRANASGRGSITIRKGSGLNGQIIGQTNNVTVPGGNSKTDPWTTVDFTANLQAGETYSFVVTMNNPINFDNGYVEFTNGCSNDFLCYDLMDHQRDSYRKMLTLRDQFGNTKAAMGHPVSICNPVGINNDRFNPKEEKDHLVCYEISEERNNKRDEHAVGIQNKLETNKLVTGHADMVCVVSSKKHLRDRPDQLQEKSSRNGQWEYNKK